MAVLEKLLRYDILVLGENIMMKKIKILICDDEEYHGIELEKLISVYGNEMEQDLVIDIYNNPVDVLEKVRENKELYDVMFLDIEMPEMTGVELAKQLRKVGAEMVICFVTSHTGYALSAFEVDAIGYVVKPVKYLDIKKIIEKAKIQIYYRMDVEEAEKKYIEITSGREKVMIELANVIYIEKRRNQCVFHMKDGERVCYDTLGNVYKQLNPQDFIYTHQGYIANFHHIKEVRRDMVCFGCGVEIPISRKYFTEVKKRHMDKIYRLRSERAREKESTNN